MMVLEEETDFSLTRQKTNTLLTLSPLIEMTHHYIFLLYMTLTVTAHYP